MTIKGKEDYYKRQGITIRDARNYAAVLGLPLSTNWFLIVRLIEINRNC